MRRLSLNSIDEASDLSIDALLQNESNPLLGISAGKCSLQVEKEYEHWETDIGQPSCLNELQYRMFMDFVYQWRFFLDDRITWQYPSSTLSADCVMYSYVLPLGTSKYPLNAKLQSYRSALSPFQAGIVLL